jgi:hypothetical protein
MFKRIALLSIGLMALSATSAMAQDATWEYQGRASTGEKVALNLDSIQIDHLSTRSETPVYFFTYQIGRDRIDAVTPCKGAFQVNDHDGEFGSTITPQSGATQSMLDRVCSYYRKTATVFAPPSNVRWSASQESRVKCVVKQQQTITTYGTDGDWFYTDACNKTLGLIHSSQIRFD